MQRRKFLATVGSLAAGSAAAIGTGAHDQVRAKRSISVGMVGDKNAYLGLEPLDATHARLEQGKLNLSFDNLNQDSITKFLDLFKIENHSQETVAVFIDPGYSKNSGLSGNLEDGIDNDEERYLAHTKVSDPTMADKLAEMTANDDINNLMSFVTTGGSQGGESLNETANPDNLGYFPYNIDTSKFDSSDSDPLILDAGDTLNVGWWMSVPDADQFAGNLGNLDANIQIYSYSKKFAEDLQKGDSYL